MTVSQTTVGHWDQQLARGLVDLAIQLDDAQQDKLLQFLALLEKWNKTFNLTAIRDPAQMVSRQLLDCLAIRPWVGEGPVLDIGTGGGLPGLPLAISCPDVSFTLLDTNGKKTRFVQQAAAELGLDNVEVVRSRIEAFDRVKQYPVITSRAFATLATMAEFSQHLLATDGCWLAMKGVRPNAELAELEGRYGSETHRLDIPGEPAERHLVVVRPVDGGGD